MERRFALSGPIGDSSIHLYWLANVHLRLREPSLLKVHLSVNIILLAVISSKYNDCRILSSIHLSKQEYKLLFNSIFSSLIAFILVVILQNSLISYSVLQALETFLE